MPDEKARPSRAALGPSFAPPRFTDPRRLGAVVGLAGAFVFVRSYGPPLDGLGLVVTLGVCALILAALLQLFWRPRWLGAFHVPRTAHLLVYGACVVGELALIRIGSQGLGTAGHADARPALIAGAVGLHFIPFGWAFGERMFYLLGTALVLLGVGGLVLQVSGGAEAARWSAVAAGWVMGVVLLAYARGAFARPGAAEAAGAPPRRVVR